MINTNINHIKFENFKINKKKNNKVNLFFKKILRENTAIIKSLKKNYKDKYNKKFVKKFNRFKKINIFGMGGSILGSKAIYNFLSSSKKDCLFIDNFSNKLLKRFSKNDLNLIISKSGNTLETIANSL